MKSKTDQITHYQDRVNEWIQLAQENPDEFEEMRRKLIKESISNASPEIQPRLEGLQWKIEHVRRRARSPKAAFIAISNMMWDSTLQLRDTQEELLGLFAGDKPKRMSQSNQGKILNFKRVVKR